MFLKVKQTRSKQKHNTFLNVTVLHLQGMVAKQANYVVRKCIKNENCIIKPIKIKILIFPGKQ